jgi:hypothetical protein
VDNRRFGPRYPVRVAGDLHDGTSAALKIAVGNLSAGGCRFSARRAVQAGAYVTLALGSAGYYDGRVVWNEGGDHGVAFEHPLHPAVLDHIRYFVSIEPAFRAEA